MRAEIRPGGPIRGTLAAPPSKSMAHRALLCAALAGGTSRVDNLAHSQDIDATLAAAAAFGAQVELGVGWAHVTGPAVLACPAAPVDCCESGSTLRFLIPLAALSGRAGTFYGGGRVVPRRQGGDRGLVARGGRRGGEGGGALAGGGGQFFRRRTPVLLYIFCGIFYNNCHEDS